MPKTYNTTSKLNKVKEPLFDLNRAKYRSPRSSEKENVETNLLKLDLTRIQLLLDEVDVAILDSVELFVGNRIDITETTYLSDGLIYEVDSIDLQIDEEILEEDIEIDTLEKLSGMLTRLINKVNKLEMDAS